MVVVWAAGFTVRFFTKSRTWDFCSFCVVLFYFYQPFITKKTLQIEILVFDLIHYIYLFSLLAWLLHQHYLLYLMESLLQQGILFSIPNFSHIIIREFNFKQCVFVGMVCPDYFLAFTISPGPAQLNDFPFLGLIQHKSCQWTWGGKSTGSS